MCLISLKNVTVRYDDFVALESVNLDVLEHDFIGLIGPNGGGKTTLIKAILEMLPYSGSIAKSDKLYLNNRQLIGYLPQISQFDKSFPISVIEVVLSGLQGQKKFVSGYKKIDIERAHELLQLAGIDDIANKTIGEVSGGQAQRVLLCRAVILEPKLLILDEPTNFVDNNFGNELYITLREFNKKMAIIMISHDIETITNVVKNIVCVNKTVHRHSSNIITEEQLKSYDCPIQIVPYKNTPRMVISNQHINRKK